VLKIDNDDAMILAFLGSLVFTLLFVTLMYIAGLLGQILRELRRMNKMSEKR
jgi:hypothetical protein